VNAPDGNSAKLHKLIWYVTVQADCVLQRHTGTRSEASPDSGALGSPARHLRRPLAGVLPMDLWKKLIQSWYLPACCHLQE
jgi:hypothetical protein